MPLEPGFKKPKKAKMVSIRLTQEAINALHEMKDMTGITQTDIVSDLITDALPAIREKYAKWKSAMKR